jgi:hypothetical protein
MKKKINLFFITGILKQTVRSHPFARNAPTGIHQGTPGTMTRVNLFVEDRDRRS